MRYHTEILMGGSHPAAKFIAMQLYMESYVENDCYIPVEPEIAQKVRERHPAPKDSTKSDKILLDHAMEASILLYGRHAIEDMLDKLTIAIYADGSDVKVFSKRGSEKSFSEPSKNVKECMGALSKSLVEAKICTPVVAQQVARDIADKLWAYKAALLGSSPN